MRKGIILGGAALLALGGVFAVILLTPSKPQQGTWKLADGSQLSLAGVTHGKTQTMRYGHRFADYLYPILTPALRKKFNCQVASLPGAVSNSLTLWFWNKGGPTTLATGPGARMTPLYVGGRAGYSIVAVDENGMESSDFFGRASGWSVGSNLLQCWALPDFPRRSREIKVRIYNRSSQNEREEMAAEFTIPNPLATNYPAWQAGPLPVTVETNGLSVSLTKFEVGVRNSWATGPSWHGKTSTRAEIKLSDPLLPLEWEVHSAKAESATGESHWFTLTRSAPGGPWFTDPGATPATAKNTLSTVFEAYGTCWLQEPAWKVIVELTRTTNFPAEELYTFKGVKIPEKNELNELNVKTNINGNPFELVGLSTEYNWGSMQTTSQYPHRHELKVRSPIGSSGPRLKIAGIRDDQGRNVGFSTYGARVNFQGSYSNRPAIEQSYSLEIPGGAKTIDVTLAYPTSLFVELLAKPTKAGDDK